VIAFEPVASTFDDLSQNVRLNGFTNVTLRRVALGEKPGECDIFQCVDGNDGGNSLYASDTNIPIERVTIENGDAFFQAHGMGSIDLCKIDVEGA
jgi:FkbM family methyltransferase